MSEVRVVNGYYQTAEGKWCLTEEAKAESKALYYSGRLAYDPVETKHPIGRYNALGEVIPFKPWPSKTVPVTSE